MGMHGVGHRRCQVELRDLLPHIPRDELDRGLHFGHHPLGFPNPVQTALTKPFVPRNGANPINLRLDISGNEFAVSTHATLYIDKVVGLTDGADALGNLLALRTNALTLLVGRVRFLCELLQACGGLGWAARSPIFRRVASALKLFLSMLKPLLRLGGRLCSRPLLGGHGARDGFDQLVLHMEQVRRVCAPR